MVAVGGCGSTRAGILPKMRPPALKGPVDGAACRWAVLPGFAGKAGRFVARRRHHIEGCAIFGSKWLD